MLQTEINEAKAFSVQGQSADVSHLSKYLKKSEDKFRKEVESICGNEVSDEMKEKLIRQRLKKELESGVQTIQYQINTLYGTNGRQTCRLI